MRLRALTIAVAAAGAVASLGLAAGPPAKGPPAHCPRFDIRGTLQSVGRSSFSLKRADGTTLTIALANETEAFWTGKGTLAGPVTGESVWAKGRHCGDAYTATWVLVRPRT